MRVINIKLLPDGSGRCRIHWFIRDDNLKETMDKLTLGKMRAQGQELAVAGRIACQPHIVNEKTYPTLDGDGIHLLMRSDDINAVTCPECLESQEAKALQAKMVDTIQVGV